MNVFDIKTEEEWCGLLDGFHDQTGLAVSLTDPNGKILLTCGVRNPLCQAIRDKPETLTYVCSQTNMAMTAEVKATRHAVLESCEAGLVRVAIPVLKDGELVAQVTGCGIAASKDEIDVFMLSRQLGLEETEINELVEKVVVGSEEDIEKVAEKIEDRLSSH